MLEVFCRCGRSLGRFEGELDIRCRCKRIIKATVRDGEIARILVFEPDVDVIMRPKDPAEYDAGEIKPDKN